MGKDTHTPMIRQYLTIKEDYADAIVFFRLGDFYEMFFDDAIQASSLLDIALTSRHKESNIPMCGVPYHSASLYIQKLIKEGLKVAIVEQTSPPGQGLVTREVTRVITPGTVLEDMILDPSLHNFIGAIDVSEHGTALAYLDISTGEGFVSIFPSIRDAYDVVIKEGIKEVVSYATLPDIPNVLVSQVDKKKTFQPKSLKTYPAQYQEAVRICLLYIAETLHHPIDHIPPFEVIEKTSGMHIDAHVLKHLDIFESTSGHTLYKTLQKTKTAMGARYLKRLLKTPLIDVKDIERRHQFIDAFLAVSMLTPLTDRLSEMYDMYRLTQKFAFGKATPKDIVQLRQTLEAYTELKQLLHTYPEVIETYSKTFPDVTSIMNYLNQAIVLDPPTTTQEGGFILQGFDATLDALIALDEDADAWLNDYVEQERNRTGLKQLKIGHHRVFGYYLEITKGQMASFNPEWGFERKQTLKNSERFTTPTLRAQEAKILEAQSARIEREIELFENIVKDIMTHYDMFLEISHHISFIDVFSSLSDVFRMQRYTKPTFHQKQTMTLKDARHPVVEQLTSFVSNDCVFDQGQMLLITGPNMSGKSTYMRMVALIIMMAQAGFYVPASEASLPIYDGIYTRIGASDDIFSGQSTFMMEMMETNEALRKATKNSLLIFDEIGRGTATYDGMALAQGILEYIHTHIQCHTMFSTHYHELTALEHHLSQVKNVHVTARKRNHDMVFLHQVKPGKSDRSYGIQVAALANLPHEVIARSQVILKEFESIREKHAFDLFSYQDHTNNEKIPFEKVLNAIDDVDVNTMTPLEALKWIESLKQMKLEDDDE